MSPGQDPYKFFSVEARELLEQIQQGMLSMERGEDHAVIVPKLLRHAHTLKGAARVVRHKDIAEIAHAAEDALVPFRDGARPLESEVVNHVLSLIDAASRHVSQLGKPEVERKSNGPATEAAPDDAFRMIRADVAEVDALLNGISAASVQFNSVRSEVAALERMDGIAAVLADQLSNSRTRDGADRGSGAAAERARSLAEELQGLLAGLERNLVSGMDRLEREMHQLRVSAEHLRLLPASSLFTSLERTARDAAHAMGKRVTFEASGGDVRLDAQVLAHVHSALTQAVRNAVAHGIEAEADRIRVGKPPAGRVRVEVVRRGNRVAFRCHDDGRGIDPESIRQSMRTRGAPAAEIAGLATPDLIAKLLRGGYSTAGSVTEVSGRGIGLDVIREAAAQLGAKVSMESNAAKGTVLEFAAAVSRTSFDALLLESGGMIGALPLDSVKSAVRLGAGDVIATPTGESIVYQGQTVPFKDLAEGTSPAKRAAGASAIVIDGGDRVAAIGVDRLLGVANIMQRPIPRLSCTTPVVAGASMNLEGNPQIVFDPLALVASIYESGSAGAEQDSESEIPALPVLVVDDSLTTRMLEQSILESAGYLVELATSAEEALRMARQTRYCLFLVDVEMPGMDGFTFVQTTRADPVLGRIPAILVTSRNLPEDFRRGKEAGASAYMVKSEFDQVKLLRTIRDLVRHEGA